MRRTPYLVEMYVDGRLGLGHRLLVVTSVGKVWARLTCPAGLRTARFPVGDLRKARVVKDTHPHQLATRIRRRTKEFLELGVIGPGAAKTFRSLARTMRQMDGWPTQD